MDENGRTIGVMMKTEARQLALQRELRLLQVKDGTIPVYQLMHGRDIRARTIAQRKENKNVLRTKEHELRYLQFYPFLLSKF